MVSTPPAVASTPPSHLPAQSQRPLQVPTLPVHPLVSQASPIHRVSAPHPPPHVVSQHAPAVPHPHPSPSWSLSAPCRFPQLPPSISPHGLSAPSTPGHISQSGPSTPAGRPHPHPSLVVSQWPHAGGPHSPSIPMVSARLPGSPPRPIHPPAQSAPSTPQVHLPVVPAPPAGAPSLPIPSPLMVPSVPAAGSPTPLSIPRADGLSPCWSSLLPHPPLPRGLSAPCRCPHAPIHLPGLLSPYGGAPTPHPSPNVVSAPHPQSPPPRPHPSPTWSWHPLPSSHAPSIPHMVSAPHKIPAPSITPREFSQQPLQIPPLPHPSPHSLSAPCRCPPLPHPSPDLVSVPPAGPPTPPSIPPTWMLSAPAGPPPPSAHPSSPRVPRPCRCPPLHFIHPHVVSAPPKVLTLRPIHPPREYSAPLQVPLHATPSAAPSQFLAGLPPLSLHPASTVSFLTPTLPGSSHLLSLPAHIHHLPSTPLALLPPFPLCLSLQNVQTLAPSRLAAAGSSPASIGRTIIITIAVL